MQENRRFVRASGCMGELSGDRENVNLKVVEIVDVCTTKLEMVS